MTDPRALGRGTWALAAGETIVWAGLYYSFAALLLTWEQTLGWPKAQLALGLTGALVMAALMAPVSGRVIDAGHGRWLLSLGALGGALALGALALVQTPAAFLAAWAAIGLALGACLYEPCFAFVTRTAGAQARRVITRITLAAGFASTIAFPAGAYLATVIGWRSTVLVFAAVVALLGAPLLHLGARWLERGADPDTPRPGRQENRAALSAALRRRRFWLIALAFPIVAINHGILINHMIPMLVERGLTATLAVTAASTVGPMQVAGRVAMTLLGRETPARQLSLFAFGGILVAGAALLIAGATPALVFAFAATQGAGYGMISILKPVLTAEALGRQGFGAIAGWLALPYLAGYAAAPLLGALIWEWGGYGLVIRATFAMAALGLVAIAALARLITREEARAAA
ncbi:MFS transporter [Halovulum dunhuangense]|uniref:MFS transporter n=1 Tax=Halovulum dunhuangense TaxID=1505036 RepID=A0A849L7A2_9RHOB|nr:MFS transporter [Halovulum dunhuangense]NNU81947.1 MFS transporter [Halovulum dunhuangense]